MTTVLKNESRSEREKAALLRAYSFLRRHRIPVPYGPAGDALLRRARIRLAELDAARAAG